MSRDDNGLEVDDDGVRRRGSHWSRRDFLRAGVAGSAAGAVALSGAPALAKSKEARPPKKPHTGGAPTPGGGLVIAGPEIAFLPGFTYTAFGQFGSAMSDGFITPPIHDGMGVFDAGAGNYRIVRNHELGEGNDIGPGRPTGLKSTAWDQKARGCTTTMTVDTNGNLLESFISLNGTDTNCSGTPTPWNTWLTCEETTVGVKSGLEKPHGYIFEVDAFADGPVVTKPYKAMGRFLHEAAAVDPDTGVVYMTEDNGPDGFYRFVSDSYGNLKKGTLQILKVKGQPGYNTVVGQTPGVILPATWVTIADPDPSNAEDNDDSVYRQGRAKGAARFLGGEGCTYRANGSDPGSCVFNSSDGGDAELGQIWQYTPTTNVGELNEEGELVLLYESTDEAAMQGPDNLCTSPNGAIIVAEDGDATNFLRALLPDNSLITIGENLVDVRIAYIDSSGIVFDPDTPFDDYNFTAGVGRSEFAGCRFSPDGKFLFVNIQVPGITLAITGDWESIGL